MQDLRGAALLIVLLCATGWADVSAWGGAQGTVVHLAAAHEPLDIAREPAHPAVGGRRSLQAWEGQDGRWGMIQGREQILVTVNCTITEDVKGSLVTALGRRGGLVAYIPDRTFQAVADDAAVAALARLPQVAWVGALQPRHKVSSDWDAILRDMDTAGCTTGNATATRSASLKDLHITAVGGVTIGVKLARARGGGSLGDPGAAAEAEFPRRLCPSFGGACEVARQREDYVLVAVAPPLLRRALAALSGHPAVSWLEPRTVIRPHVYYATAIVQGAGTNPTQYDRASARPLWAAGLRGEGQVVGCGDTGVDLDSCFFRDSEGDAPGPDHRKVAYYREFADGRDDDREGHGTHVASILMGSAEAASAAKYDGLAPSARLGFTDLGDTESQSLDTPRDLAADYYLYAYERGVRVHADSWGGGLTSYSEDASAVDRFHWENPDFLGVLAAGNKGAGALGVGTVTSPATAKNVLAVGATLTAEGATAYVAADATVVGLSVKDRGGGRGEHTLRLLAAAWGAEFDVAGGTVRGLLEARPAHACSPLATAQGKVLVATLAGPGGGERACSLADKARAAQAAGAAALLIANDGPGGFFPLGDGAGAEEGAASSSSVSIPVGGLPRASAEELAAELAAGRAVDVSFRPAPAPAARFDSMAGFSSVGPTRDGRVKPDLLAPGENVRAADSQGTPGAPHCRSKLMSGTSMATPLVAGGAALVRQYFSDGLYPTGSRATGVPLSPSGALVKAVLLNGAAEMRGYTEDGLPLDPPPSVRQGWGRLYLAGAVVLPGGPVPAMHVEDRRQLSVAGQTREVCLTVPSGGSSFLRATLVWHDPPAAVNAARALVNDLDLVLRSDALPQPLLGGGGAAADSTNNVERVSIERAGAGNYVVEVVARQVVEGPQPYALVVTGDFAGATSECEWGASVRVDSGPEGLTADPAPAFAFSVSSEGGAAPLLQCRLTDGAGGFSAGAPLHDWERCTSPRSYASTPLPDNPLGGAYRFQVRPEVDTFGGVRYGVADGRTFSVDTAPPATTLLDPLPPVVSTVDSAELAFATSDESSAASTECRLDADRAGAPPGAWAPCTSPQSYSDLLDGGYTFRARGVDAAGNTEGPAPSYTWAVAVLAPQTVLAGGPYPARSRSRSHSFSFGTLAGGEVGYECSLAAASAEPAWAACTPPSAHEGLADGAYVFSARAFDAEGNRDATPARVAFEVDTAGPAAFLRVQPPRLTASATSGFHFASDAADSASFRCALVWTGEPAAGPEDLEGECTSPVSYNNLRDGPYRFTLRAQDDLGNEGQPVSWDFSVDPTPPGLSLSLPPVARSISASWTVDDGLGSGVLRVECRVEGVDIGLSASGSYDWRECSPPLSIPYASLQDGRYRVSVRATDQADNEGAPVEAEVLVDGSPPTVTKPEAAAAPGAEVEVGGVTSRYGRDLEFSFTASDGAGGSGVARTECRLQVGASPGAGAGAGIEVEGETSDWEACESPTAYPGLRAKRTYTLLVRAVDVAGNVGPWLASAPTGILEEGGSSWVSSSTVLLAVLCGAGALAFLCLGAACWRLAAARRRRKQFEVARSGGGGAGGGADGGIALGTMGSAAPRGRPAQWTGADGDGQLMCPLCDAVAPNEATLKMHMDEHEVIDRMAAGLGGGGLTSSYADAASSAGAAGDAAMGPPMRVAVQNQHGGGGGRGGTRPPGSGGSDILLCPICQEQIKGLNKMNRHLDAAHGIGDTDVHAATAFQAAAPGRGAHNLSDGSLTPPHSDGEGDLSSSYACPVCGARGFTDLGKLDLHMDIAHDATERPAGLRALGSMGARGGAVSSPNHSEAGSMSPALTPMAGSSHPGRALGGSVRGSPHDPTSYSLSSESRSRQHLRSGSFCAGDADMAVRNRLSAENIGSSGGRGVQTHRLSPLRGGSVSPAPAWTSGSQQQGVVRRSDGSSRGRMRMGEQRDVVGCPVCGELFRDLGLLNLHLDTQHALS